ncbi:MAG: TRAP transporter permease [Methylocystaceae bacterium]|nr:TRAP transporter permease [Methylocystaceae bacterium]
MEKLSITAAHSADNKTLKFFDVIKNYWVFICAFVGVSLNVNQVFNLRFFSDYTLLDTSYYYILVGLFVSSVFLLFPRNKQHFILNLFLSILVIGLSFYFAYNGSKIIQQGWDVVAPPLPTLLAGMFCFLILEALRRTGGMVLFTIGAVFFVFPLFAEYMPGFLWGPPSTLEEVIRMHALGTESIIGVPMRVVAGLLIGFLLFGSALVATGGGEFFMAFANALLGRSRGGPAKVAILASGLFGSLSGSVISNVVTTGQITISTMKRTGYPARYAAAVEACASTGGTLMPPVMGAVAFIMAEYLNVSYGTVITAALVPALLFYIALLFQVDIYAARTGLKGVEKEELPDLKATLKQGWHYLFAIAFLIYLLVGVGLDAQAPYYATLVLIVTSFLNKKTNFSIRNLKDILDNSAQNFASITGVLGGVGLIVGALSYTGVGGAFSRELLQFAGDSVILLLVFGALTSFILGMGMTVSACYVFLAVILGPAMIKFGLDPVASHLFILYWGMMSYITPPVALAAVTAASIANSDPLKTGFQAMRLGVVNIILPFIFVLNPTLILKGAPIDILHDIGTALVAVMLISACFEGWMYYLGRLTLVSRVLIALSAMAFLLPGWQTDLLGCALFVIVILLKNVAVNRRVRT